MISHSSKTIEKKMIQGILRGDYPMESQLQPERELAANFQVGRPTIREVLMRLQHAGWISLRKGQPAVINDYWTHGNVHTIVDIVMHMEEIPDEFVLYFLEFRIAMTPQNVKKAVAYHYPKVIGLLAGVEELADQAEAYAAFDWELQKQLARLTDNPIFPLMLNSFDGAYEKIAVHYFSHAFCRKASYRFYNELMAAALKKDKELSEQVTRSMMEKSYSLWKSYISPEPNPDDEQLN